MQLDEIARRAGVGPGTLYRHFPTKEALFEAVVHDRLQRLADDARALRCAEDAGAALLDFIDRLIEEAAPKRDLVDALASAGSDVNAAVTATAADLRSEIGYLLARAQHSNAIRRDIGTADLMAIISAILYALRTRSGDQADPQRSCRAARRAASRTTVSQSACAAGRLPGRTAHQRPAIRGNRKPEPGPGRLSLS